MDSLLSAAIQQHVLDTFSWEQMLVYNPDSNGTVNLAEAIKTPDNQPRVPFNATDQPDIESHFLKGSFFRLPAEFTGSEKAMVAKVKKFFEDICGETKLSMGRGVRTLKGRKCLDLKCHCGRLNNNTKDFEFEEGKTTKTGTIPEDIKRKRSKGEKTMIQRIPDLDKKAKKKLRKDGDEKQPIVDTRSEDDREKREFAPRVSGSELPSNKDQLCKFKLTLTQDEATL